MIIYRYFEVDRSQSTVLVKAHIELSEIDVLKACQELGDLQEVVYGLGEQKLGSAQRSKRSSGFLAK
jgi:hypothetical protein